MKSSKGARNQSVVNLLLDRANPLYKAPIKKLNITAQFSDIKTVSKLLIAFFHESNQIKKLKLSLLNNEQDDRDEREELVTLVDDMTYSSLFMYTPERPRPARKGHKENRLDYAGEMQTPCTVWACWGDKE